MPWTRDVEFDGFTYTVVVDIQYLTNIKIIPSVLHFPAQNFIFNKCANGIREFLFRVP